MNIELIRAFFGWCTVINGGLSSMSETKKSNIVGIVVGGRSCLHVCRRAGRGRVEDRHRQSEGRCKNREGESCRETPRVAAQGTF